MNPTKTRYYLEPKNKDIEKRVSPEVIMAEISYGYSEIVSSGQRRNKPFRFSLKATILPASFGKKETNFKFDKKIFERNQKTNKSITTKMTKLQTALNDLVYHYEHNSIIPTPSDFKKDLNIQLGRVKVNAKVEMSILEFLYKKIAIDGKDSGKSKKSSLRKNTIKTYRTVSHLLESYQIATNNTLYFSSFNDTKYWELWDVLNDILMDKIKVENPNQKRKQTKQEYGYLVNSLRKYQGALIRTLKDALKEGYKTELNIYDEELVLKRQDPVKDVYINEAELLQIINADVDFDEGLKAAKNYMIIGSLTGMRYESMREASNVEIEHYKDDKYDFSYIHSVQNKTSTEVIIPLLSPVLNVVGEDREFPKVLTNPKVNEKLKDLFKFLKLDRLENVVRVTYDSGTITTKEPLFSLISTHDCKKSFYTNLSLKTVKDSVIDNITHPDKTPKNAMGKVYNKSKMLDKAKLFVDEIIRINSKKRTSSEVYRF